ncbi:MAG: UDP-N-acetylmuramate--L-alanine ligase, partial [Clostridia bacterium]|nr:UDP-N-acetylmuramate--L-alanine ligase [Clostridia bacterium]
NGEFQTRITLGVPGEHNVSNALTAIAAATLCGVGIEAIANGVADFHGAGRRFEFLGTFDGVTVADDYAHHPTEITATLTAAKAMGYRRVWAIFQPFTFSRTARHLDDFAKALSIADTAVVSDIMGSREHNTWGVHSDQITAKMDNGVYIAEFPEITDYIVENVAEGDLVVTMGGGNVYYCARMIRDKLQEREA